jgi:hypothetical protein
METFFNKTQRSVTTEFPLTGEPIGSGANSSSPTLKLSVRHHKNAGALIAIVTYVEKDHGPGYSVQHWQSDWPLIRIATKPVSRYGKKALLDFAEQTLRAFNHGVFDEDATVGALRARVISEEVAA